MRKNKFVIIMLIFVFMLTSCNGQPDITIENRQFTVDKMEENAVVSDVAVDVEDEKIHCAVSINQSLSKEERINLGETCAKILNVAVYKENVEEIGQDDLGDLYNYYDLEMTVARTGQINKTLHGVKQAKSEQIHW